MPLRKEEYALDPKPLLKLVMSRFLGGSCTPGSGMPHSSSFIPRL